MPDSRWDLEIAELLNWMENANFAVQDFFSRAMLSSILSDEEEGKMEETKRTLMANSSIVLPVLPLRGLVVYPNTAVPLTVGQPRSIRLMDDVLAQDDRLVALVASRKTELETPGPVDLYSVGTIASVHRLFKAPDGTIRLLVQGMVRFKIDEFVQEEPYLKAKVDLNPVESEKSLEIEAMTRKMKDQFSQISNMLPSIPEELVDAVMTLDDALQVAYNIANFQSFDLEESQRLLALDTVSEKLHELVNFMTREVEMLEIGQKIQRQARSEIGKVQREYFLREQLKAIQSELGEDDEQTAEVKEFRKKIAAANMPEEAEKQASHELDRMARLPTASAEYGVIRTYLDWMVSLPW